MKKINRFAAIILLLHACSASLSDTALVCEETEERIGLCAVGDNIVHSAVYTDAKTDGGYSFEKMYASVKNIISNADIAFINQESICAGHEPKGYPLFCTPDEIADDLIKVGFDVVNIANNHMLDGDTGINTGGYSHAIDLWKSKNILLAGGYRSEADSEIIRTVRKRGITVSFLSYTYGTNVTLQENISPYVPYTNSEKIEKDIKRAREVSDFVVISMHWGEENSKEPTVEQRELAEKMSGWGADLIIGHHSHILQSVETIERDGRKTLVAYSLGNFLSTQTSYENLVGGILKIDIVKNKKGTHWENVSFIPTVCHYGIGMTAELSSRGGISIYPLRDYTENLCAEHGANVYGKFTLELLYDNCVRTHLSKSQLE